MTLPLDHSGQLLGNWRVLRPLGVGGFGTVYEAEHSSIPGRRSAIKVLHPQMALNADIKRRFLNEASAASRAEHENIVQIFDGGVAADGTCYVVMELLSGQSLEKLLSDGPLTVPRTLAIATQVAAALAAAHKLGIVHRDLKPDNIFIIPRETSPEFVKVLDFGIAKLQDGSGATQAGTWMGTPPYMAPEQWQTQPDIDGRADLYALGVILFRCLMGRLPFSGATPFAWLEAHLYEPVPELTGVRPPALAELVQRLLAKRREDRPASAQEVLRELTHLRGETPTLAMPASAPAGPDHVPAPTRPSERRRIWPLLLGLSGLALGGALLLGHRQPARPARPVQAVSVDGGAMDLSPGGADLAPIPDAAPSTDMAAPPSRPDLAKAAASPPEKRKRAASKHDPAPSRKPELQPPDSNKQSEPAAPQRKYAPIY